MGNVVFWLGLYAGFPLLCVAYVAYQYRKTRLIYDLLDVALPYIAPVGIEIMVLLMSPAGGQLWVLADDWRQGHHTHIYDIPALHSRR